MIPTETWIGTCPCGRPISRNARLCLAHSHLLPLRHAGIFIGQAHLDHRFRPGDILFTCGGTSDICGRVPFTGSALQKRLQTIIDAKNEFYPLPPGTLPIEVDSSPISIPHMEMIYNDVPVIDQACGLGSYERFCNSREFTVLQITKELYKRKGTTAI